MSGATVTADHAQTSDRTAESARRIVAVAPVDHPGVAETGRLRLLALLRARGWRATVTTPAGQADAIYLNGGACGRLLPVLRTGAARRVRHVHDTVTRVPAMWRRADLVLADSAVVAAALPGPRAAVVHVPVDADPPPAAAPGERGVGGPVVGFVGRIEPRKSTLDLRRAALRFGADDDADRVERLITGTR